MDVRHSPEVEQLLGRPAPWIARRGMLLLGVLVGTLLLLSTQYYYPSTLAGDLVLTTVDPPRRLLAQRDMTVERVLVAERDSVLAGQTLLIAADARARFEHVLSLEDRLLEYRGASPSRLLDFVISNKLLLGPIQDAVNDFQQRQEVFRNLADRRLDGYTSAELADRIGATEREVRQLRASQGPLEDAVASARDDLRREKTLREEGLRNTDRLATAETALRQAEERQQERAGDLRAASLSIELMRNQIEAYRSGQQGSSRQAGVELGEAFDRLQAAVASWKWEFTVVSPVTGTAILQTDVRAGSYVREDELLATVLPTAAGHTIGRIMLPVAGSGRLAVGQDVVVAFDRWPALEYGSVTGRVSSVGLVPIRGTINVEVTFPNGLMTSNGGQLAGSPLMEGQASIIVDRRSLLSRLIKSR